MDIEKEWLADAKIDSTQLDQESLKTPLIHAKWLKLYTDERMKLKIQKANLAKLKLEKYRFYLEGSSEESRARGWEHPGSKILKSDVEMFLDADPDLVKSNIAIAETEERIQFLDQVIRCINNRGFQIKNAIDWLRWSSGG